MRPTFTFLLLFFTTIYICAQDTTPPVLDSVTFNTTSAEAGDTVTAIVEVYDEMSEIFSILIQIKTQSGLSGFSISDILSNWTHIDGNRYSREFTILDHDIGGKWYVSYVSINDTVGNQLSRTYAADDSPYTFNVTSTMPDTTSPMLNSIAFDKSTAQAGETVSVIVDTQDDLSGLESISVSIVNPEGGQQDLLSNSLDSWTNLGENRYKHEFTLNEYGISGNWYVNFALINDHAGNTLFAFYIPTLSPATLNVTSTTTPDTTQPTLTDITFEPSTAQAGETVSIIVETQDDLSGIFHIVVDVSNPEGRQKISLSDPLSLWTDDDNNRYRYDFTLDELALSGTWYVSLVQLRDNANNYLDNTYTSDNPPYTFEVEEALSIENHKQQKLTVYPNPLESFIHIDADFSIAKIYDLHGRLQQTFRTKTADVSALEKGIYILELYNAKLMMMATFKFIKK